MATVGALWYVNVCFLCYLCLLRQGLRAFGFVATVERWRLFQSLQVSVMSLHSLCSLSPREFAPGGLSGVVVDSGEAGSEARPDNLSLPRGGVWQGTCECVLFFFACFGRAPGSLCLWSLLNVGVSCEFCGSLSCTVGVCI